MSDARLRIAQANHQYTDAVLADIDRIRRTAAGANLFRALCDAGRGVTVERPDPPTEPPNAWTRLSRDSGDTDIVIAYDPIDWPSPHRFGALPSDAVLFGRLQDALTMTEEVAVTDAALASEMEAYLRQRTTIPDPPPRVKR